MSDQAQQLRNLVRHASMWSRSPSFVPVISVCGARGGVGVSTLAALIAGGLRRDGRRVILVETQASGETLADRCQLQVTGSLDDVLSGRRTVRETLLQGPSGVSILPCCRPGETSQPASEQQIADTLRAITGMGTQADVVLVDAGLCPRSDGRAWWQEAQLALLVSTSEPISIMDGYAGLKQASAQAALPPLWTIVNQCRPSYGDASDQIAAEEVPHRIARACQRFLDSEPQQSVVIPYGDDVELHAGEFTPPLPADSPFARAIERLTARLAAWLDVEKAHRAA